MKKITSIIATLLCAATIGTASVACAPRDLPEEGRDVLITVAVLNDSSEKETISKFINAFKASQSTIDVKAEYIDAAYYSPVLTDWAGNTLADVVWTAGDKHAPLSAAGVFEPLNSYFEKEPGLLDDIYPSLIETTKLNPEEDTMYFVPRDYNKLVIAYNKDMFDDAGLDYPENDWTWQDFMDTCKALRQAMDENRGNLDSSFYPLDGYLSWTPAAYTIIKGFGGEYMDKNGQSALVAADGSTTAVEAGLEQIYQLVSNYYAGSDIMGESGLFEAQQAAMRFMSRPAVSEIRGAQLQNFDFVAFPTMPVENVVGVGCSGYGLNAHSGHKAEAWEFLKFIISEEGQKAFCETGNGVPVLQSMRDDASWRDQPVAGLNQEAFVYDGTEDLFLNYYCYADPSLYSDLDTRFTQLIQGAEQWVPGEGYDGYTDFHTYIVEKNKDIEDLISRG